MRLTANVTLEPNACAFKQIFPDLVKRDGRAPRADMLKECCGG
jgi:hypothetical protein